MSQEKQSYQRRLTRRIGVIILLLAGVGLLGLGAVPWVSGVANIPGSAVEKISASGGQAAPLIPALGLVVLAGAVALALARRWGIIITCFLTAAAGVATTVISGVVLNDPARAMRSEVTATMSVVLPTEAISEVSITIWTAISAVFGVLLAIVSILIWRSSSAWERDTRHEKASAREFERPDNSGPEVTDADLWDLLSDGQDPSP